MYEYTARKKSIAGDKKSAASEAPKSTGSISNSALTEILAGRAHADAEMMGHREDLAPSLAAKMSKAFGMDLSNMQVYHSDAMEGTETRGIAGGNKIVLSNDIDLNTLAGQEVLGHEISHLHAQSQGLGMGHTGLYNDAALESRADAEGMLAARGQSIFGESTGINMVPGMGNMGELTPLSSGMGVSAGAPLQAKKGGKKKPKPPKEKSWQDVLASVPFKAGKNDITYSEWKKSRKSMNDFATFAQKAFLKAGNRPEEIKKIEEKYKVSSKHHKGPINYVLTGRVIDELAHERLANDMDIGEIDELIKDLYSPDSDKETTKLKIKEIYYKELLKRKNTYGKLPGQMDAEDLAERSGMLGFAQAIGGVSHADVNEDTTKEIRNVPFKKENGEVDVEKETEYQNLHKFYHAYHTMMTFQQHITPDMMQPDSPLYSSYQEYLYRKNQLQELAKKINGGPELNEKQLEEYQKYITKKKEKQQAEYQKYIAKKKKKKK